MIRDKKLLEEFEREFIKNSKVDINKNIQIFEELLKFAKELKKFPPKNLLEGIEIDIKYARAINGIKRTD
ncbi:MAG: hypothetical protein ACK4F0_00115 [Candidatus Ratteibacteria bacterium]